MLRTIGIVSIGACVLLLASARAQPRPTQPQPARPRITGIGHVVFQTSDARAAEQFYGHVLGLARGTSPLLPSTPPSAASSASAAPPRDRLLFTIGARQHVAVDPVSPLHGDDRLSHIALQTDDVGALRGYLAARGMEVRQPADRCEASAIQVTDPDGHTIEFVQAAWPPVSGAGAGHPAAVAFATAGGSRTERTRDAAAKTTPLSARLLHAGITVRDEEAAHHFYRDVLGFSEIWRGGRTDGQTDWINMRVPDGTEYLEYMLVRTPPDRQRLGVLHHVCLIVPDIQAAWDTAAGRVEPSARARLSGPNVGRNGRWQLNLYDPDGTRTELMEPFTVR